MTRENGPDRPRLILLTGVGKPGQVGEAVAGAFARAGDRVLLVDRTLDVARARASEFRSSGWDAAPYGADLADGAAVESIAATIRQEHGELLDAVVHMAGGWQPGSSIAESTDAQWRQALEVNLMTSVNVARSFIPLVRAAAGTFVFFASEAVAPGAAVGSMAPYAVAKLGVATIMRAIAQEERQHGVRANAVAPAAIRTASNEAAMGPDAAYVERDDVASAVRWLCSDAARGVSGELIRLRATSRPPARM